MDEHGVSFATANPLEVELAERLVGLPFEPVVEDASPAGGKVFALWNPPVIDEETGARRSALTDATGTTIFA